MLHESEPLPDISLWHCLRTHNFKQIRPNHPHSWHQKKKKFFSLFNTTLSCGNQALVTVACCHSLTFCMSECKKGPWWSLTCLNSNNRSSISPPFHLQTGQWVAFSDPPTSLHPGGISASKDRSRWVRASCSSASPVSASQADRLDVYRKLHSVLYQAVREGQGRKNGCVPI